MQTIGGAVRQNTAVAARAMPLPPSVRESGSVFQTWRILCPKDGSFSSIFMLSDDDNEE